MSRATTFWEDLGIGLLAGATILLSSAIWMLLTSEGDRKRLNRIGPSSDVHGSRLQNEHGVDHVPGFVLR